jgi:hypothetical protein
MGIISDAVAKYGPTVLAVMAVVYVMYMVGLILVLRRLHRLNWQAFVPVLNYYAQVKAVNAPTRWFPLSLLPFLGVVYAGSVAIRVGKAFGRKPFFSVIWLTIGAPLGLFYIALSKRPVNPAVLDEPAQLFDVKAIRRQAKRLRHNGPQNTP